MRWRSNGELEYLGRLDHQLKVRGHRVEPAEIEAALERHPGVRRAVVVSNPSAAGHQLVAYVEGGGDVTAGDLRRFLRDDLPEYMVPSWFQQVAELPVTPSGKVDRTRLPAIQLDETRAIEPPRTAIERELVSLWEELLELRPIGVHDNFFDLGGHSLIATRMCGRLSAMRERRVHVAELFQAPTIAELASRLANPEPTDTGLLVPFSSRGSGAPYFCVPGAGDNPFIFADIARHLGTDRPTFSFRYPDDIGSSAAPVREAIDAVASRFIDEIRKVRPHGPYLLGGYCAGGLIAFEMANQLRANGETVGALTVFDMFLPGGFRMADSRARITHHVDYLRAADWSERLAFVARHSSQRLMRMGRRLSRRVGHAAAMLASENDYTPRKIFSGRLTLFRASGQAHGLVYHPHMGWQGLAEDLVVHEIEGRHTDVYKEPNISAWVGSLRETLSSADAQVPTAPRARSAPPFSVLGRSA